MFKKNIWNNTNLVSMLLDGGVVVMPTDTIYGVVGKAEDKKVVEKIYKIRKRNPQKPCIILMGGKGELKKFGITLTKAQENIIEKQNKSTSFIVDCVNEKFKYLHRGTKTLAFRVPIQAELQNLLKKTGPLVAPSANTEALPPARNIKEAKKYFGDLVDLYIDGGEISGKASKIIRLHKNGTVSIIRE